MDEPKKSQIQWFPGHMTRTRRKIEETLPLVDVVAEVRDARIPLSSENPELASLIGGKPRVAILNKADMADEAATARWLAVLKAQQIPALAVDCKSGRGIAGFVPLLREVLSEKIAAWEARGMVNRAIRVMVVGVPNVGKSSLINRLTAGGKAKVEDRPGVTRNNQWFTVRGGGALLLDTPGVLWPKFEDQRAARRLAYTGAIKDQVMDVEELACDLLEVLCGTYADRLSERYKLPREEMAESGWELLEQIGRKRGMLIPGGEVNTERAAIMLLDEYRGGKLGRITLEQAGV